MHRAELLIAAVLGDSYTLVLGPEHRQKAEIMVFRALCGPAALLFATLLPTSAWAAPAKHKGKAPAAAPAEPGLSLEEIAIMLSSTNADEVKMAIEASAMLGSPDVIPMLTERVRAGLPPDLLDAAVDSLAMLGDPSTADLFVTLTRHRRPSVRLRAVTALVSQRAPGAEAALIVALGDSNAEVREAAAQGLGQLGATSGVDALFKAFDRGVDSAGPALGKLAGESQLARILGGLGRTPLIALSPIFDALFERRDISEATKLRLVGSLADLGTADARGYLEGLKPKLSSDTSARVRKAIDEAVARIAK
jgi:HEAT repeat protein